MAEGGNVEDLLNCPICLEQFEDPKILQCHHSFCGKCLNRIQRMGGDQQSVSCPTCRETTEITAIKPSFTINSLLEMNRNKKITATPQSEVTNEKCQQHNMPRSTFCKSCSLTLCPNCAIQQHKDHDVALVDDCYDDEIIAIHSNVTDAMKIIAKVENASQLLSQAETDIIEQERGVEETVNSAADKLIQGINQQREELLQQARENAERKIAVIKAQQNEAAATVSHLKTSKEAAEALLQTGSPQQVLQEKSNIIQGLETSIAKVHLEQLSPAEMPDLECKLENIASFANKPFASITASHIEDKFVMIASPLLSYMHEEAILAIKYTGGLFKSPSAIISAHVEATHSSDMHPCKVTDSETKGTYDISFTPTIHGLHKVVIQANGHPIQAVSPISIHVPGKRYPETILQYQSCFDINGIGASRNGKKFGMVSKTINNAILYNYFDRPRLLTKHTIATPKSSKIAIADDGESIFVIDVENWQVKKYDSNTGTMVVADPIRKGIIKAIKSTEFPQALTIHQNGQIYVIGVLAKSALMFQTVYMKVLNQHDLSCQEEYNTEIFKKCSRPSGIALDSLGNIYISDDYHSRVFKIDSHILKLEMKEIIGKGSSKGQLKNPQAIAIDSDDILYVADTGNNRISVFNTDGEFLTCLGENELCKPNGIAICNNGTIYVADAGNNRVVTF